MSCPPVMWSVTSIMCKIGLLHGIAVPLKWPLEGTPRGSTAAPSITRCDAMKTIARRRSAALLEFCRNPRNTVKALSSGLRGRKWEPEQGHMMKLIIQLLVAGAQGFYYQKSLIS
ncbi:hypothetical protein VPH35_099944 [Triticum aestivum]